VTIVSTLVTVIFGASAALAVASVTKPASRQTTSV